MKIINILLWPFNYILDFFMNDDIYNNDLIQKMDDMEIKLNNLEILDRESIVSLTGTNLSIHRSTNEIIELFDKKDELYLESKIRLDDFEKMVEDSMIQVNEKFIYECYQGYGDVIETCLCYDFGSGVINIMKVVDNLRIKLNIENPLLDDAVLSFCGKNGSFDLLCDILKRSIGSPIFNDETKEDFIKRNIKPLLI
jgi:hypothetical protein